MRAIISSPSRAYLDGYSDDEFRALGAALAYTNEAAKHQLKRVQNNHWFRSQNNVGWQAQVDSLKAQVNQRALYYDGDKPYIRPGSLAYLDTSLWTFEDCRKYATPKKIPWAKPLPFQLYDYQEASWERLLEVRHGNVSLCTGSGKSAIILKLLRESGLHTAIVAPSRSIFNELKEKLELHMGKKYVGTFGDGKKVLGKRFTICISDSLANIKPDTPEFEFFSKLDMMIVDESHTFAAETLEEVCHGVLSNVPYRYFLSATQTRGDGTEKLLQSIIGKTVYELTTGEAVDKGYIAEHEFVIKGIYSSNSSFSSSDALEEKREHFLRNRNIAQFIARLANAEATINGRQTLVLVEELSQISELSKLLTVPFAYAHSEKRKERLAELGLEKVDPADSVEKFNKREVMVLAGTSCIATGTNIFPTHNVFNWVGGSSEIKTKQGPVGRAVRLHEANPWHMKCVKKEKSIIWDFDVLENHTNAAHLEKRIECYKESNRPIRYIKVS